MSTVIQRQAPNDDAEKDSAEAPLQDAVHAPAERKPSSRPEADASEISLMTSQPANADNSPSPRRPRDKHRDRFVRLSVNLSMETAEVFKALIDRKGLSISEGIRRAIAVWKFLEDEKSRGNEIAIIEKDESVRKVVLL